MIDLLNQYGRQWAASFGPTVLQDTVFLGLVFFVLHRMRGASARVRYAAGMIGLAKLLLPPLIRAPRLLPPSVPLRSLPGPLANVSFIPVPAVTGAPADAGTSFDIAGILILVWAACAVAYLAVSVAGTVRLALVLRDAEPLHGSIAAAVDRKYGVRLYRSNRIAMPLTLGIFPRKIFVPRAWDRWSGECRRMIIHHEMAHITRRDGIFQIFQIVAQALYWFHPLVWLLNRRLCEYREMACDDASIGDERGSSVAYSRYLVEIAESMMRDPVPCTSASALIRQRNELLTRVRYQMKGGRTMRLTRPKAAMVLAGLVLLILPFSWYFAGASDGGSGADASRAVTARSGPAAGNAGAGGAVARPGEGGEVIEIRVAGDEGAEVNGTAMGFDVLERELKRIAAGMDGAPVIKLICKPDVSMGTIFRLQDILRKLDLVKMNYLTAGGEGLKLKLPPDGTEKKMDDVPQEDIAVIVIGAGNEIVMLDERDINASGVEGAIRKRLAGNPALIVWIRTTDEARYGSFMRVLEGVKKAGAMRILINE